MESDIGVLFDLLTMIDSASTALEFVQALRIATDVARLSTLVSIYQAGESLYELFDKVCVIYEGKMAYFGPANRARQYFIDMGFEPANRQTTADFLVAGMCSTIGCLTVCLLTNNLHSHRSQWANYSFRLRKPCSTNCHRVRRSFQVVPERSNQPG